MPDGSNKNNFEIANEGCKGVKKLSVDRDGADAEIHNGLR
jgi:hypothetical protein